jgi:hypothetical protein
VERSRKLQESLRIWIPVPGSVTTSPGMKQKKTFHEETLQEED